MAYFRPFLELPARGCLYSGCVAVSRYITPDGISTNTYVSGILGMFSSIDGKILRCFEQLIFLLSMFQVVLQVLESAPDMLLLEVRPIMIGSDCSQPNGAVADSGWQSSTHS